MQDHLQAFKTLLTEAADFIRVRMQAGIERDELVDQYAQWRHRHARALGIAPAVIHQYETANPLYMSVDGMMRYWRRRKRREQL